MGPFGHISVALFLKRYILRKGMFVEDFSLMIRKNKSINFLMESVETPQQFSLLSSFIFNILTRLYNFLISLIIFLISKQNNLVQSEQQKCSYSISQLVKFWFDKMSPPSEEIYFYEWCWMICSISLYIVSDIHIPLPVLNGCNFLFWHFFCYQQDMPYFLMLCSFFYLFPHRINSEQFLIPSPYNQNDFSFLVLPIILFSMEIWSSSLI